MDRWKKVTKPCMSPTANTRTPVRVRPGLNAHLEGKLSEVPPDVFLLGPTALSNEKALVLADIELVQFPEQVLSFTMTDCTIKRLDWNHAHAAPPNWVSGRPVELARTQPMPKAAQATRKREQIERNVGLFLVLLPSLLAAGTLLVRLLIFRNERGFHSLALLVLVLGLLWFALAPRVTGS